MLVCEKVYYLGDRGIAIIGVHNHIEKAVLPCPVSALEALWNAVIVLLIVPVKNGVFYNRRPCKANAGVFDPQLNLSRVHKTGA